MTISTRAMIINGTLTAGKFNQKKNKTEYGITTLIRVESKTKICNLIEEEVRSLTEFNDNEKSALLSNLADKFKYSDHFKPPFNNVVSFYTGFAVPCDFSADPDVDDVQSGDTVIIKFVTKYGKTQVFGKNVCYVKLYPKAVKLESHGTPLVDTFSGMSEGDLV